MTRAPGRSAFVAAVFALHPLHVESVAWASSRKDVLAGACFAATLLAYARHAEAPSRRRMAAVAACLGLGLLSKSILVTVPCLLLLLDYWPLRRLHGGGSGVLPIDSGRLRAALVEKWPLFLLSFAAAATTWSIQQRAGATAYGDVLPLGARAANALHSYGVYLLDSVWPVGLAMFYPHPGADLPLLQVATASLVLAAVSVWAIRGAARRPYACVGWLWYLGMLLPMIGLVQVGQQARADRYTYLPLIGLALAVAWGAHAWGHRRVGSRALGLAAAVAIAALALRSWDQVGVWRDSRSLFGHALAVTERNHKAHMGLAYVYERAGLHAEAAAQYTLAVEIYPRWVRAHLGRARALIHGGDLAGGAASYERALLIDPDQPAVRSDLGVALVELGRVEAGLRQLEALVAAGSASADAHGYLADRAVREDRDAEAVAHYRSALQLEPDHPGATNNLAWLLATSDDPDVRDASEAVVHAERAVARNRTDPNVLDTLATAYAAAGRSDDAIRTLDAARAQLPDDSGLAAELDLRLQSLRGDTP
jgi:tetratricopeptide (TPR) repeat protein